jgi:hypothetical protein
MVTWGIADFLCDMEPAASWAAWWFRGWASAGPAATTFSRRTPVPVHDLRVDSPMTHGVGGIADGHKAGE